MVIKLEYSLKLKIKHNDWLLADTCPACGHVSACSQSLRFILSLRLYSNFITLMPGVRSVVHAASQLPGRGPTDVDGDDASAPAC